MALTREFGNLDVLTPRVSSQIASITAQFGVGGENAAKLAKQLSQCSDSYLIRIGYYSGGTIGWLGRYYIFGIFEDQNKSKFLVPLKKFDNKNLALNELKK